MPTIPKTVKNSNADDERVRYVVLVPRKLLKALRVNCAQTERRPGVVVAEALGKYLQA